VRKILLIALICFWFVPKASCYLLVEDIPNLTHAITSQIENYAKYIQEVVNQITQIENQLTALERFGNPNYYVNLLGLSSFTTSISQLSSGVGQTIAQYRSLANGASALSYTGGGLYSNLTGQLDRYGNVVNYNTSSFNKFATVNSMVDDYTTTQKSYNTQLSTLLGQLQTALQNLNADKTQVGTEKYAAQVNAINGQINALNSNSQLSGQRIVVQQTANQNDDARMVEAQRQQLIQERQTDLTNEAQQFGNFIGGPTAPSGGVLP
jgi:hypothetical protein